MEYKQCKVRKRGSDTYTYMWVSVLLARVHQAIAIRGESGWVIDTVWHMTQSDIDIVPRARDFQEV